VDGLSLKWLGGDQSQAYFRAYTRGDGRGKIPTPQREVRRLNLQSGQWEAPIPILGEQSAIPDACLAMGRTLVVLVKRLKPGDFGAAVEGYRLLGCDRSDGRRLWEVEEPSRGEASRGGAFLLAPMDADVEDVAPLTEFGGKLLVCAGPKEDLLCLDPASGKLDWRLGRLWEYERGYTGPSVWRHHLGRFGGDSFGFDLNDAKEKAAFEAERKRFDEQYDCLILGGPVVVEVRDTFRDRAERHFFMAISRARSGLWPGQTGECQIYEINSRGEPISLSPVPRAVLGSDWTAAKGGLVWACRDRSWLRVRGTSENVFGGFPGEASTYLDCDWFIKPQPALDTGWLSGQPAGDPIAFTDLMAVRTTGGGSFGAKGDHIVRFPLALTDLATGQQSALNLALPFQGTVKQPTVNLRGKYGPDGKEIGNLTWGPYLIGLTDLQTQGNHLRITVAMDRDWSETLEFPLGELKPR
jgi:hypothetical protein